MTRRSVFKFSVVSLISCAIYFYTFVGSNEESKDESLDLKNISFEIEEKILKAKNKKDKLSVLKSASEKFFNMSYTELYYDSDKIASLKLAKKYLIEYRKLERKNEI